MDFELKTNQKIFKYSGLRQNLIVIKEIEKNLKREKDLIFKFTLYKIHFGNSLKKKQNL